MGIGGSKSWGYSRRDEFLSLFAKTVYSKRQDITYPKEGRRSRPWPTPGGVPPAMMFPGSSLMKRLM
jgi:hypothetical protein